MGIIDTFIGSFYSAETYRRVRASGSFMMGYALLVVLLTTLVVGIYYGRMVHREFFAERPGQPILFDDLVQQIANQVPVMTLKDDTLTSNEPTPTVIKVSGTVFDFTFTDEPLITIDTSGKASHTDMKTPILVTDKEYWIKEKDKTEVKPLSDFTKNGPKTIILNRAVAKDMANQLITVVHAHLTEFYVYFGGFLWFFIALFMYVVRLFMLLALGLVGLLIGSITKTNIDYAAAVGLASVSYTPVALLDTALFIGLGYSPHTWTLLVAGSVALFAAIKVSHSPSIT